MISVIIPAYNSGSTIVHALESVAAQTFTDYEVIVVDDCSSDNTGEVVAEWMRVNLDAGRWHFSRQSKNTGPAGARNAGIAVASGDWLAFLDADDIWLPWKLEFQMNLASKYPEVALWCADCIFFPGEDRHNDSSSTTQPFDQAQGRQSASPEAVILRAITLKELGVQNLIATSTVLVKSAVVKSAGGFDAQFRVPEDYDLWLRVAALVVPSVLPSRPNDYGPGFMVHSAIEVTRYRHVSGSLSMDDRKFLPQVLGVLDKAHMPGGSLVAFSCLRTKSMAIQYWHASWMAFQRGARVVAIRHLVHAFCLDPNVGGGRSRALLWRYLVGRVE
jgi:hypothetical protein